MRDCNRRIAACLGMMAMALSLYSQPAAAYLDPGTGSVLLQGLIGAVAALALTLKLYWHRLIGLFRRETDKSKLEKSDKNGDKGN